MEPSIPFHALVKLVDAEHTTNEKVRTRVPPLKILKVISKLESQNLSAETFDSNPETLNTQGIDPNTWNKPHFWKYSNYCHESNHSVSNCFRKQREVEEMKRNSHSLLKSIVKSNDQYFKAHQNQMHSKEQPSSYPVKISSCNSYDSKIQANSRNRYFPDRSSRFRSHSTSRFRREKSFSRYRYCKTDFNCIRISSRSRHTEICNQRGSSKSPLYSSFRNNYYRCFF